MKKSGAGLRTRGWPGLQRRSLLGAGLASALGIVTGMVAGLGTITNVVSAVSAGASTASFTNGSTNLTGSVTIPSGGSVTVPALASVQFTAPSWGVISDCIWLISAPRSGIDSPGCPAPPQKTPGFPRIKKKSNPSSNLKDFMRM